MLNGQGDLSAVELAFFSVTFLLGLAVLFQRGFHNSTAWIYLVTLSVLRIVGNACLVYSETNNDYSPSLIETYTITNSIGTAPLLLSTLGFLEMISLNMSNQQIPAQIWRVLHGFTIVILILAIVGGSEATSTTSSHYETGRHLVEASSILFLLVLLVLTGATLLLLSSLNAIHRGQKKLIFGVALALPLILVKIIYLICTAFAQPGSAFYAYSASPDVWLTAFMQFLPEGIVVVIYLIAGLLSKPVTSPTTQSKQPGQQYDQPFDQSNETDYGNAQLSYRMQGDLGGV